MRESTIGSIPGRKSPPISGEGCAPSNAGKKEGLPVHRHLHQRLGTVYASKVEVDAWMKTRGLPLVPRNQEDAEVPTGASPRGATAAMVLTVGAIALGILAYVLVFRGAVKPPATGRVMIAVLPFENLSGDSEQEFFSDGLTEEMITELGQLQPARLGVIARTSSMIYKGAKKSIGQVAAELHVDYLLEGSVRSRWRSSPNFGTADPWERSDERLGAELRS